MWTAPVKNSYCDGSHSIGIGYERRTDETDFFGGIWLAKNQDKHWRVELGKVTWGRGFTFRNGMWFSCSRGIGEILARIRRARVYMEKKLSLQVQGGLTTHLFCLHFYYIIKPPIGTANLNSIVEANVQVSDAKFYFDKLGLLEYVLKI